MSKNIMITDSNGSSKKLSNISHIVTDLYGSNGTCTWIPKDEVEDNNITLSIVNGKYTVITAEDANNRYY